MSDQTGYRPWPFVLPGEQGALLAVYFPPMPNTVPRGDVLVVPAFAEEMNRCRAMVSLQAHAWAAVGIGTLVVDPRGTGDSAGEFSDGDWNGWRNDLERGLAWLRDHGNGCVALLGVRLGAIMAAELASRSTAPLRLVFWQPVINAKAYLTQFLRIRIAAEMDRADGIKSTDELRRSAADGQCVEVSGYSIAPALVADLDRISMPRPDDLRLSGIDWFEVLPDAAATVPRASTKLIDEFRAAGVAVELRTVAGPPFWQVHERELAPELIAATTNVRAALEAAAARERRPASVPGAESGSQKGATESEQPMVFTCNGVSLVGVVHQPVKRPARDRGVVIVVAGGPQYRAGAHRQFVSLARKLAAHGFPVLRFDLRGMGDSGGSYVGFQHSEDDIRAAIDALAASQPQVHEVVLFGECESASGILFYAWRDLRVTGAVLVNPWVRTDEGQAQVIIKHYYWDRLKSPEFWRSVREGRYDVVQSVTSFFEVVRAYFRGRRMLSRSATDPGNDEFAGLPLPEKTAAGLRRFRGRVLLLMSGRDYIAREFDEVTGMSRAWAGLREDTRIERRDLLEADHTFSKAEWKAKASDWVAEWVGKY